MFLKDSPAITKNIINKILTRRGFSAAYLSPSNSGIFFSTLGIGSGTFHSAHAANIGNNKIIPIPMLAKMSDIFPEVEKSWKTKIAANILLIESKIVIPCPETSMARGIRAEINKPIKVHPSLPPTTLDL